LTVANGEQTAQLIVVNDFYDALGRMREYQKQLDVLPGSFRVKLAEMEGYEVKATERWGGKFGKRKKGSSMMCYLLFYFIIIYYLHHLFILNTIVVLLVILFFL